MIEFKIEYTEVVKHYGEPLRTSHNSLREFFSWRVATNISIESHYAIPDPFNPEDIITLFTFVSYGFVSHGTNPDPDPPDDAYVLETFIQPLFANKTPEELLKYI